MGKIIQEIQEYNFSKKNSASYDLGVTVSQDRLAYYICDKQGAVLFLRALQLQARPGDARGWLGDLKSSLEKDGNLHEPFHSLRLALVNAKTTLVPHKLYKKEENRTYLSSLTQLSPEEVEIIADYIPALDAFHLFAVEKPLHSSLNELIKPPRLHHVSTGLLEGWARLAKEKDGPQIYLHVFDRFFLAAYFERSELIFANHFTFRTSKDFLYFTMLIFDQFRLAQEKVPVYIAGLILPDSEIYNLVHRYVKELHFLPAPSFLNFSPQFEVIPEHQYYDLFSLKLCA